MAKWRKRLRQYPAGTAIASQATSIKNHAGDSTISSPTTDSGGEISWSVDGSPGFTYWTSTYGGVTKFDSGMVDVQISELWSDDFPHVFSLFSDGIMIGLDNELAVTAPGGTMQARVPTGMGIALGHPYRCTANTNLTIASSHATLSRLDRVVIRLTRATGKTELAVLTGTPATTPLLPALTQNSTTWEVALGAVSVAAAATTISSGNITDERLAACRPKGGIWVSGRYIKLQRGGYGLNQMTIGANTIASMPIFVPKRTRIDRISAIVKGGGKIRLGLRPLLASGLPGTLVYGSGEITPGSGTVEINHVVDLYVDGPRWWLIDAIGDSAGFGMNAVTVAGAGIHAPRLFGSSTLGSSSQIPSWMSKSYTFGALPELYGTPTIETTSPMPWAALRVA